MRLVELKDAPEGLRQSAWELYLASFPAYERWGEDAFRRAVQDPAYRTKLAVDEKGGLMALLYYWVYDDTVYVEFLAVNPLLRGQNIGTRLIEKLIAENPGKRLLLEIDPPIDEISIRRLHFYERLGFVPNEYEHIHPSYISGDGAHPHLLVVLTHGSAISYAEFMEFRAFMLDFLQKYGD